MAANNSDRAQIDFTRFARDKQQVTWLQISVMKMKMKMMKEKEKEKEKEKKASRK